MKPQIQRIELNFLYAPSIMNFNPWIWDEKYFCILSEEETKRPPCPKACFRFARRHRSFWNVVFPNNKSICNQIENWCPKKAVSVCFSNICPHRLVLVVVFLNMSYLRPLSSQSQIQSYKVNLQRRRKTMRLPPPSPRSAALFQAWRRYSRWWSST